MLTFHAPHRLSSAKFSTTEFAQVNSDLLNAQAEDEFDYEIIESEQSGSKRRSSSHEIRKSRRNSTGSRVSVYVEEKKKWVEQEQKVGLKLSHRDVFHRNHHFFASQISLEILRVMKEVKERVEAEESAAYSRKRETKRREHQEVFDT
jgi:hypothetical protein